MSTAPRLWQDAPDSEMASLTQKPILTPLDTPPELLPRPFCEIILYGLSIVCIDLNFLKFCFRFTKTQGM